MRKYARKITNVSVSGIVGNRRDQGVASVIGPSSSANIKSIHTSNWLRSNSVHLTVINLNAADRSDAETCFIPSTPCRTRVAKSATSTQLYVCRPLRAASRPYTSFNDRVPSSRPLCHELASIRTNKSSLRVHSTTRMIVGNHGARSQLEVTRR